MIKNILQELKHHAPFTLFGALTGVLIIMVFYRISSSISFHVFYVLHPLHVILSALVTASMYKIYAKKANPFTLILIGYFGSVGIATLSDSIIPYIGEIMLNLPNPGLHLGFIEKWWLVNPLVFLGIAIAYFSPNTKFPHAGHVLLSTWASLFHIIMALGGTISLAAYIVISVFLFIAVLIPCCLSDIIFPLLFVRTKNRSEMKLYTE